MVALVGYNIEDEVRSVESSDKSEDFEPSLEKDSEEELEQSPDKESDEEFQELTEDLQKTLKI